MNDKQVAHALYLDDAYRVERVLADGIGGKTELVSIEDTGPFVRKSIPVEMARRRVWSVLADCDCARLPRVVQTYELPDKFVVVYDFVPGDTLEHCVEESGRLSQARAFELAAQVCEAAQALHAQNVVHRDISPRNVIVSADGAHLIDFGIARLRVDGATRDTASLGTWGFASPEQYGFKQTDARSDVYSIGCLLGYMVTGVRPDAEGYDAALTAAAVSDKCRAVVAKACSFEPSERYQSADSLADDLRNSCKIGGEVPSSSGLKNDSSPVIAAGAGDEPVSARRNRGRGIAHSRIVAGCAALAVACAVGVFGYSQIVSADQGNGGSESADSSPSASEPSVSGGSSDAVANEKQTPVVQAAPASENPLVISESGWSATSNGYVHYAVALKNKSQTETVITPAFMVTGRDEEGDVVFSERRVVSAINPGETFFDAGQAGDGKNVPASIDFTPLMPEDYNLSSTKTASSFSVLNLSEKKGNFGTNFVGELRNDKKGSESFSKQVRVTVYLRDAEGNLVAGYSSFVPAPAEGETVSFSVNKSDNVQYASAEAYAETW